MGLSNSSRQHAHLFSLNQGAVEAVCARRGPAERQLLQGEGAQDDSDRLNACP